MSRTPLGFWKPRPGETREQFAARVVREMKAVARKKRLACPNPNQEQNKKKGNPSA